MKKETAKVRDLSLRTSKAIKRTQDLGIKYAEDIPTNHPGRLK